MSSKTDNMEIVHEGWLTKSPPTKRVWRARWRRRWFVLRHSGELPGQYYLYYYTDRNCRTLKGQIDLDQCEQVDAGLRFENNKQKYQHMFDVRTPKRTYYLAAETEADMNRWVECVCLVCGLKPCTQEDNLYVYGPDEESSIAEESLNTAESPPVSPSSTASGPYIPISECISGKPLMTNGQINRDDYYDSPRRLQPPSNLDLRASGSTTPPLQSPATDAESVFTDEEWANPNPRPSVNWETFPRPSDSSLEESRLGWSVDKRYTKPVAPPRPPKPQHLILQDATDSHTYLNLEESSPRQLKPNTTDNTLDGMYDFPRSHHLNGEQENIDPVPLPRSRHCYTNAAPVQINGDVFRYDFAEEYSEDDPVSPHLSESSSTAHYSNLPSPASLNNPPVINRGLKPGRKTSESASNEPSPQPVLVSPPNVNRKLKPIPTVRSKDADSIALKLCAPPAGRSAANYGYHSLCHNHANLSPSPRIQSDNSDTEQRMDDIEQIKFCDTGRFSSFYARPGSKRTEIQYLDLDLDSAETSNPSTPPAQGNQVPKSPSAITTTVYKTVDFLKTEAFNRTRQKVEEERKQNSDVM